ncbi:DNA mismatch repair protein [Cryobacterium sp. Hz9]|uniref:DNA mismatch repair protein n=1 Tax=Cryobacterium sp. Hz9 TaxID=1259167 RepID=UPI001069C0C2|nr:DNA mismatch repair protein [Cryobacterium sp. Hz9]TFB69814.1 DNA mismatch repair protein [Cryobacterium sp. Hz9]
MTTLIAPIPRAAIPNVRGRTFIRVRDGLWRIVDPSGAVIGYLEHHDGVDGDRFSARRVVFATRTRDLGVFCRIEDAVDCFR